MATTSGDANGAPRSVMPYVAYAVVLVLLGGAGWAFWAAQRDRAPILPKVNRPPPALAHAEPAEAPPPARGLKLPPRAEAAAPAAQKPAQATPPPSPVPIPSTAPPATLPAAAAPAAPPSPPPAAPPSSEATAAASPAADKPAPAKTRCTVEGGWPAEKTDQGKAIQGMLRDLGLYDGTVYGTVGPTTRAAIRKFQVSAGEPETGEPDQALFESLRKKCAAP